MILPALLAVSAPVVVGLLLDVSGLMGLLAGGLTCGFAVAIFMANAGGAWDNAKKYIEAGHLGGKGSEAHKAAVVGDTVGDPFKDTSGPSLNILIKLMSMVAVVFAGLIVNVSARSIGAVPGHRPLSRAASLGGPLAIRPPDVPGRRHPRPGGDPADVRARGPDRPRPAAGDHPPGVLSTASSASSPPGRSAS